MHSVAGSAIDDRAVSNVFTIVNHDGPEVDESKENNIGKLLQREDKWENMVRDTLRPAIKWVESMRCVRTWHDPLVVGLMQGLIDKRMVKTTVNPVDEKVGKANE